MLERVTYLAAKPTITPEDLPIDNNQFSETEHERVLSPAEDKAQLLTSSLKSNALKDHSINAEVEAIMQAWQSSQGNMARAATILGISRTTLWRKMVKYGLNR
jgi:DNA-binding NtrC family response regulator